MTERMGLAAVGRQNRQRAALARRAEIEAIAEACRTLGGWRLWQWDLQAAGPLCTVH